MLLVVFSASNLPILQNCLLFLAKIGFHLDLLIELTDVRLVNALTSYELLHLLCDIVKELTTCHGERYNGGTLRLICQLPSFASCCVWLAHRFA